MAVIDMGIVRLAWRNLWRNKRRTTIMLAAIGLGVWAMVFIMALVRGLVDQMLENSIHALPGEVQIHHIEYRQDPSVVNRFDMPSGTLLKTLNSSPVVGWSARLRVPAVISSERETRAVVLLGIDPVDEAALDALPGKIVAGNFVADVDERGVVIGAKLAEQLETGLGKRIVLMSQDPDNEVADRGARIVGIFRAEIEGSELAFAYTGRAALQELVRIGNQVTEIAATANDYRNVNRWLPQLATAAGPALEVASWDEIDSFLGLLLPFQDGFALVLMGIIFITLSFGLVNTLAMAVFERVREIGLMQALGMRPSRIMAQLLVESLLLLVIGLTAGNLLAWLFLVLLSGGIDLSAIAGAAEDFAMGKVLYPVIRINDVLISTCVVVALGLLASLLPARRAARLDPVQALNTN